MRVDVESFLAEHLEAKAKHDEATNEILTKLLVAKTKTESSLVRMRKQLDIRKNELNDINKTICKIAGHVWTPWVERDGFLDRSWYYTRECACCGKGDTVHEFDARTPKQGEYISVKEWEAMCQKQKADGYNQKQKTRKRLTATI